ncbi:MAG TPA: DNA-packaging protein, partial [Acholeplasmataceae bacterium]|nr:DNA-packaging protein [Acholeplasmataceae bacterium]
SDEKLNKCRTLSIAEWEHCGDTKVQYVLAYDVSRSTGKENALCALVVIKLTPRGDGTYHKQIVNIFSSEGQHDTWQAKFLKEKVREYKASILVIDANGIGSGVVDQLVLDLNDGNPPYKVVNDIDNQWTKYEAQDAIPMVYALKSQRKETKNSDMINNIMKVFNKLDVELLKTPNEGLKELEKKNKKKFKDDSEEIALAEIPYILTNNLCDEIMNLLYKQRGNDSEVEQISRSIPKDKFSALMYGLFWVYLEEKKNKERNRDIKVDMNKLFLFKKPNIRKY